MPTGEGRTKQSFRDECDINIIMSRYLKTGIIDFVSKHSPQYLDLDGQDFTEAMLIVAEAKSLFQDLPSAIRTEFENDPAKFLDFVHDPENLPRMEEMGLLKPGAKLGTPPIPAASAAQPTPLAATPQATTITPQSTPPGKT